MFRLHPNKISSVVSRRFLSVKELPWCAPSDSPVRRQRKPPRATTKEQQKQQQQQYQPIDTFGIVAAMCRPLHGSETTSPGIIGINRKLPWKSIPTDRKLFESLTQDRILVLGRKTLLDERDGSLDHIGHAKHCIVVSKSISRLEEEVLIRNDKNFRMLKLARSLDEALDMARVLEKEMEPSPQETNTSSEESTESSPQSVSSIPITQNNILCWIGGGEGLYEEALKHKSAKELHLSVVDLEIDLTAPHIQQVATFPAKYRWDHNYDHKQSIPWLPKNSNEPSFEYRVYHRIVRR